MYISFPIDLPLFTGTLFYYFAYPFINNLCTAEWLHNKPCLFSEQQRTINTCKNITSTNNYEKKRPDRVNEWKIIKDQRSKITARRSIIVPSLSTVQQVSFQLLSLTRQNLQLHSNLREIGKVKLLDSYTRLISTIKAILYSSRGTLKL